MIRYPKTLSGVVQDLPEHVYHARPELSSTQARQILDSPARFNYARSHPQPHKDAYSLGSAVHTKVLGVGANVITYPDEHLTPSGNPSTKAETVAWADEQRANGLVVIGAAQAAQVDGMAESLLANRESREVFESIAGHEVSVFAEVEGVDVRARFDLYDGQRAADVKTARDASYEGFNAAVGRHRYQVQEQWYREAHTAVTGTELEQFQFLVVETTAPYLVGVWDLDFMWEEHAKKLTRRAREQYLRCTETGIWPGYKGGTLTPPTWAVWDDDEEQEIRV